MNTLTPLDTTAAWRVRTPVKALLPASVRPEVSAAILDKPTTTCNNSITGGEGCCQGKSGAEMSPALELERRKTLLAIHMAPVVIRALQVAAGQGLPHALQAELAQDRFVCVGDEIHVEDEVSSAGGCVCSRRYSVHTCGPPLREALGSLRSTPSRQRGHLQDNYLKGHGTLQVEGKLIATLCGVRGGLASICISAAISNAVQADVVASWRSSEQVSSVLTAGG